MMIYRLLVAITTSLLFLSAPLVQAAEPAKSAVTAKESVKAVAQAPATIVKKTPRAARPSSVNTFNRLLKPQPTKNPPPGKDGIHDPSNLGTNMLLPPRTAFKSMVGSNWGNNVNWVKTLEDGKIAPRWERDDADALPIVFDLNIVREVKGSMPNVVYPHKPHTEWLDCSNCHPAIFIPQKGANQISMASILLGEKCGVCHGKVAFPISSTTCRLCHSQRKEKIELKRSKVSMKK